ncbi:MAG: hypothetical protein D3905_09105 [Candidatus Electrothrix sp. AS4_5]|nr:hypothetical protein [Candidatus Electrothrix gigas]MCI5189938.1 hypothetical protein [Candidatus Electrothrix gigas]
MRSKLKDLFFYVPMDMNFFSFRHFFIFSRSSYTLLYLVYRVPYNTTDTILQQPNFFDTLPTSL